MRQRPIQATRRAVASAQPQTLSQHLRGTPHAVHDLTRDIDHTPYRIATLTTLNEDFYTKELRSCKVCGRTTPLIGRHHNRTRGILRQSLGCTSRSP